MTPADPTDLSLENNDLNQILDFDQTTYSDRLLSKLTSLGCRYMFGNPGSEFAPVIESFARQADTDNFIKPITAPHEYLAVNMAYGAYLATQTPQAVMVHASIGAANSLAAVMNASRMQIPFIFIAGRTPIHEQGPPGSRDKFVHWAQESFDQATPLREYVKWDYELRDPNMLEEVIERAFQISMEDPKGPVYLTIPREYLFAASETPSQVPAQSNLVSKFGASEETILDLQKKLLTAQRPLVLTKTIGKDEAGYNSLANFCEKYKVGAVFQDAHYCNMSTKHPLHLGYSAKPFLDWADFILVIDMDVPWIQSERAPNAQAEIVHIGHDPLFQYIPLRSHRGDAFIKADPVLTLECLNALELSSKEKDFIYKRHLKNSKSTNQLSEQNLNKKKSNSQAVLTKQDVAKAIANNWSDDLVLVNELSLPIHEIPFNMPLSYYRTGSASGLGWACGFALGQQICRPDKTIINVVGDGAYIFGNPLAYHWVAKAYSLPIITIILNNGGMKSIENQTKAFAPKGHSIKKGEYAFTNFTNPLEFHLAAPAFSASGEIATHFNQLNETLKQSIKTSREFREQRLINAIVID